MAWTIEAKRTETGENHYIVSIISNLTSAQINFAEALELEYDGDIHQELADCAAYIPELLDRMEGVRSGLRVSAHRIESATSDDENHYVAAILSNLASAQTNFAEALEINCAENIHYEIMVCESYLNGLMERMQVVHDNVVKSGWTVEAAKKVPKKTKSDEFAFLEKFTMGDLVEFIVPYKGIKYETRAMVIDSYPDRGEIRLKLDNKKGRSMLDLVGKDIYKIDFVPWGDLH